MNDSPRTRVTASVSPGHGAGKRETENAKASESLGDFQEKQRETRCERWRSAGGFFESPDATWRKAARLVRFGTGLDAIPAGGFSGIVWKR